MTRPESLAIRTAGVMKVSDTQRHLSIPDNTYASAGYTCDINLCFSLSLNLVLVMSNIIMPHMPPLPLPGLPARPNLPTRPSGAQSIISWAGRADDAGRVLPPPPPPPPPPRRRLHIVGGEAHVAAAARPAALGILPRAPFLTVWLVGRSSSLPQWPHRTAAGGKRQVSHVK